MGLEAATHISNLDPLNPTGSDDYSTADDHLRLVKAVLQTQFPNFGLNAITADAAELNKLDGLTASQVELNKLAGTSGSLVAADLDILAAAAAAGLTATELLFLNGVTSNIQTQLATKAAIAHSHTGAEISALDAGDTTTGVFAAARIPTHTGEVTGQTALTIALDAVTYAKMQNVVTNDRILGNIGGAGGIVTELTGAQVLTLIGVETGATADQTGAEIEAIVNHDSLLGFLGAEHIDWAVTGAENVHTDRLPVATAAAVGGVELATAAEVDAGTANKIVDAAALAASSNYGFETGSFVAAFTGFTTDPENITFDYTKLGNLVMMAPAAILNATSNNSGMSSGTTDVPASIRPVASLTRAHIVRDNGVDQMGKIIITAGGRIQHNATVGAGAFTSSGLKGFPGSQVISYFLD